MDVDEATSQPGDNEALRNKLLAGDRGQRAALSGISQHTDAPILDKKEIKDVLNSAQGHIAAKKSAFGKSDNIHVSSAAKLLNKTLCLASPHNKGDSTLSSFADDAGDAGHYSRSFNHPSFKQYKSGVEKSKSGEPPFPKQDYVTGMVNKSGNAIESKFAATVGLLPNVATFEARDLHRIRSGKSIREPSSLTVESLRDRQHSNVSGTGKLYDASLNYSTKVTKYVADKFKGKTVHLKVGAHNDYPAVMVHFDARSLLDKNTKNAERNRVETASKDFTHFLMSRYIGIVNAEAAKMGLNTAVVERSSFGHSTPSVAPTKNSFRINLGMMPPVYAEAHISALKILDAELVAFKGSLANRHEVDMTKDDGLSKSMHYNKDGPWNEKSILGLAFSKVESGNSGQTLMSNTMRNLSTRNSVDSDSYHAHLAVLNGGPVIDTIQTSLTRLFEKTSITPGKDGKLTTSTVATPNKYDMSTDALEGTPIHNDELSQLKSTYSNYLKEYSAQFTDLAKSGSDDETKKGMNDIARTLHDSNADIAISLDLANQMLMVHTLEEMQKPASVASKDIGHGSDSEDGDDKVRGKKIIAHDGMRSLTSTTSSVRNSLFRENEAVSIADEDTYFETEEAIKAAIPGMTKAVDKATANIVIKDINACVNNGEEPSTESINIATEFPVAKAWIIDTTSATTSQMGKILNQFKDAPNAQVLCFASSGLKNEQGGADRNNYGTARVFAKSGEVVGAVLSGIDETDHGLAKFSHEYRRTMKAMGLVPTNASILLAAVEQSSAETSKSTDMDMDMDMDM
ncbi:hypothetical protein [Collimonas humicola]|uniref:hypothetical protein n=1 Tax=Collimonas humicola TaxID=2825886 RepID=UPI001B8D0876|nr:hypothetical protein [Collimonas humicola]